MAQPSLAELTDAAVAADGPAFPPATVPKLGGVDPLGLRQINFDLMDEVLPGLNNVARHVRPFVVVAWAWRRASQLAQAQGKKTISAEVLQDFVDRIEVIYVWSQFLKNSAADLPGRNVLVGLLKAKDWSFGGANWQQRRKTRKYSTALSAPINYGPGLKMLGWLQRHSMYPDVLIPTEAATPALDGFEARMSKHLNHPAFNAFGKITVTAKEARAWADDWSLDAITAAEAMAMGKMLFGAGAPQVRQLVGQLIMTAIRRSSTTDADRLRRAMAGRPSRFVPPQPLHKTWAAFRRLQVRQLFRLSLEALFWWTIGNLEGNPKETDALVESLIGELPKTRAEQKAGKWLRAMVPAGVGPTDLMERIESAMENLTASGLAHGIAAAIAFCLAERASEETRFERHDRLPLSRARQEAAVLADENLAAFLRHVLESWVLAQHTYWSVGRGLADARAGGKTLLRLKVILEEGGWTLAPGASRGRPPVPTRDRLASAITLARESRLIGNSSPGK